MIGLPLFDSEPIGKVFYLNVAIFEISKKDFITKPPVNQTTSLLRHKCVLIKPPACCGIDVSTDLSVVTPV